MQVPMGEGDREAAEANPPGEVTQLLRDWAGGSRGAGDRLFDLLYPELKSLARQHLGRGFAAPSLRPTELVHEAYLRLAAQRRCDWQSRNQFLALAALFIRRILVDDAKHRLRGKRGEGAVHVTLDDAELQTGGPSVELLSLDRALVELAGIRMVAARVIELRCFAGLSVEETADVLGTSRATILRSWRFGRAWLGQRLGVA